MRDDERVEQTEDLAIRDELERQGRGWPVPDAPLRPSAWGQDLPIAGGQFRTLAGNQVSLAAGTAQEIIRVVGDDALSGMLCVAVSAEEAAGLGSGDVVRCVAELRWGTGGCQHLANVDVGRGSIFAIPGSTVRVKLENEGTQVTINARASIGYFPNGGRPTGATRTSYLDTQLATSTASDFGVPRFARRVTVFRSPQTANYRLEFLDSNDVECYEIGVGANAQADPFLLSNDITTVRLNNLTGAAIDRVRMVFDLAF